MPEPHCYMISIIDITSPLSLQLQDRIFRDRDVYNYPYRARCYTRNDQNLSHSYKKYLPVKMEVDVDRDELTDPPPSPNRMARPEAAEVFLIKLE